MSSGPAPDQQPPPAPQKLEGVTELQPLCMHCAGRIVRAARQGPADTWRAPVIICQLALFQGIMGEAGVTKRVGDEPDGHTLSLVLAEIGCMGCGRPAMLAGLLRILSRAPTTDAGVSLIAKLGKREATHPLFPWIRDMEPPAAPKPPPSDAKPH